MKAILVLASVLVLLALAVMFDLLAAGLISNREGVFLVFVSGLSACGLTAIAWMACARRTRGGPRQAARPRADSARERPPGAGTIIGNSLLC